MLSADVTALILTSGSFIQNRVLKDSVGFRPCGPFKTKLASRICVVCFKPRRRLLSQFALAQWCGSRVRAVPGQLKVLRGSEFIVAPAKSCKAPARAGD